jgi:uncharacterized membrane protein YdjX (TVP38/TMEM64 family)
MTGAPRGKLRFLPLALIAAGMAAIFLSGLHRHLSWEALRDGRFALLDFVAANPVAAPAAYVLAYVCVTAFSLPGAAAMTLAGGFLFGTLAGGALAVIGATIGATAVFAAARTALGDRLRLRTGGMLARIKEGFRRDAASYLLFLRLVPAFPFFVVNIAAALLGARPGVFVATTLVGIVPGTLVFASIGAGLGSVFDAGARPDLSVALSWPVLGPLLGLGLLALLPVAWRRLARRT